jgi:hypothetical protein
MPVVLRRPLHRTLHQHGVKAGVKRPEAGGGRPEEMREEGSRPAEMKEARGSHPEAMKVA